MFTSARYSYLVLRLGLAAVFLWFGVEKMLYPTYWFDAWVPQGARSLIAWANLSGQQFIYLNGIFEILTGLSLATGVFTKLFATLAAIFLIVVLIFVGISEVTIRDIGLIGGFLAVLLWPNERNRF